jgi:hypothetical protein
MLTGELLCLFLRPTLDPEKLLEKEPSATPGATKTYLEQCIPLIEALPEDADIETIKTEIMELADSITKENGGRGAVLWPLRYTLSGLERSPDPFSLIYVIGKEEAMLRIEEAIGILD